MADPYIDRQSCENSRTMQGHIDRIVDVIHTSVMCHDEGVTCCVCLVEGY